MKTKSKKGHSMAAKTASKANDDNVRSLVCPKCGVSNRMAQIDIIPGYAKILGVKDDGAFEWAGETEVDWDMQRSAFNPSEFVCLACNEKFKSEELGI